MSTEVIELPPAETALEVYQKPLGLDPWLEKVRAEVTGHVPDLTTRKGREHIASLAFKVRKSKTALDALGKKLVDDLKDVPKRIDAERKRMRDMLDALADDVRRPLTEWEEAEEARVQGHKGAIEGIAALAVNSGEGSESIRAAIGAVEAVEIGPQWEEFEAEAARTKDKALAGLRERLTARDAYEAEQAELARLRADAAAREQKEREERIAREAAERAQREAESKAQAEREAAIRREQEVKAAAERRELELRLAAERAERERVEAIQAAEREKAEAARREAQAKADAEERQRLAIEAERKRVADEQARVEREARAREADKAHKKSINNAALAAFVAGGMPEDCAKAAVTLIAKGQIPAVRIIY